MGKSDENERLELRGEDKSYDGYGKSSQASYCLGISYWNLVKQTDYIISVQYPYP